MPLRFILFIILILSWKGSISASNLMEDLIIVEYWDRKQCETFPVHYNNLLYGGYINMPSARMNTEGIIGAGFSYVPPYHNYNLLCQLTPFLEISGNYRVFRGVDDPILTPLGFGDMSDKGANVKLSLFKPEDSGYQLPGLAVGLEDFMGTRNFKAKYAVITHVFLDQNLEVSLGIGAQRIRRFFGGAIWMPFLRCETSWLRPLSLIAEYDATPYHSERIEKHPKGRTQKSKINAGLQYRFFDAFDLSVNYIRGEKVSASFSTYYDFGHTKGFVPKINDSLPYKGPVVREPIGWLRPESALVNDLIFGFREQGIELLEVSLGFDECAERVLRLKIYNNKYRLEPELRLRLSCLLSGLIPDNIEHVYVGVDAEGFLIQEYHFPMTYVRCYGDQQMGGYELATLAPLTEITKTEPYSYLTLFEKSRDRVNWLILPKTHTFFGSSKGKFKYSLGVEAGINGFLAGDVYYSLMLGHNIVSDLYHLSDTDRLNPSQIINVRTDIVRYYQQNGITLDEAYMQKCWNMGCGFYSKLALGYFEEEYAGFAAQALYYPLYSDWAFGIEGAIFKKRAYKGFGFTNKVRKLHGFVPEWKHFPFGSQYFFTLYYDWKCAQLEFKAQIGKFLANDYGIRYEVFRYFESGLRVGFWYTHTNGHDKINGQTYYDKGVEFSMPLDMFYTESTRKRWGYGMNAWLRDVGVTAETGQDLYQLINEQRQGL